MTQLVFSNMDMPRARRTDPATSKAAAEHVDRTGLARRQCEIVFEAVKRWPGRTAQELAANHRHAGGKMDRYDFGRRLPELRNHGLLRNGPARTCKVSGREAETWESC